MCKVKINSMPLGSISFSLASLQVTKKEQSMDCGVIGYFFDVVCLPFSISFARIIPFSLGAWYPHYVSQFSSLTQYMPLFFEFLRKMSDNIPLNSQRACTVDGELYNLDVFSYVQPPVFGTEGSLNLLIMYVTRALENSDRLALIQVWNFFSWHKKRTLTQP